MTDKPEDKEEGALKLPKAKGRVIVRAVGGKKIPARERKPLPWDSPEKPATLKVSFRATEENVRDVTEHLDRLVESKPGMVFTATDAIRSLIMLGGQYARQVERATL